MSLESCICRGDTSWERSKGHRLILSGKGGSPREVKKYKFIFTGGVCTKGRELHSGRRGRIIQGKKQMYWRRGVRSLGQPDYREEK